MATSRVLTGHLNRIRGFWPLPYANRNKARDRRSVKKRSIYHQKIPRYPVFQLEHEPILLKTFSERLSELNIVDPELNPDINIGYENPRPLCPSRAERRERFNTRTTLEKLSRLKQLKIPLEEVNDVWVQEVAATQICDIIQHYGIFHDLFNDAYFYPRLKLSVSYDYDDDHVTPVYYGNKIAAADLTTEPHIDYDADPTAHYTLLCTNPDGHLQDNSSEVLHWLVNSLEQRTFNTLEFYRQYQDHMTPVDLVFCQSEWDDSVTHVFHNVLDMPEPSFEFLHPPPYHPAQVETPHRKPFNLYLDKYRHTKDLQEEVLRERLKLISPFKGPVLREKYPNIYQIPMTTPQWLRTKKQEQRMGVGRWRDMYDDTMRY